MLLSTMAIAAQVPFWGSLQTAFEAIDLDESGAISFEEFKKCVLTWMWESKKHPKTSCWTYSLGGHESKNCLKSILDWLQSIHGVGSAHFATCLGVAATHFDGPVQEIFMFIEPRQNNVASDAVVFKELKVYQQVTWSSSLHAILAYVCGL